MDTVSYRAETIAPTESADRYADRILAREAEITERIDQDRDVPEARRDAIARYLARRGVRQ